MRSIIIIGLLCSLLVGCASHPKPAPSPQAQADQSAMLGMMLLAGAAQEKDSSARQLLEVKIAPPALEALSSIARFRTVNGKWPEKNDITVPDGATEITLTGSDTHLDIGIKNGEHALLHCRMIPDGTVILEPAAGNFMRIMQSIMQNSGGSSWPAPVYFPPPPK